jgi:ferric-dicitrate binding protein FerR (iron transport regulator)
MARFAHARDYRAVGKPSQTECELSRCGVRSTLEVMKLLTAILLGLLTATLAATLTSTGPSTAVLPAAAAPDSAPTIGHSTKVIPSANLLRGKSKLALHENDGVAENDQVRTQSSGRVRLVLNDGSILNVGSSSLLTVRPGSDTSRQGSLELAYGRVRAVVSASANTGKRFEIRTSTAVCGVLGTTLFVDSSRNVTDVANLSDDPNSLVQVTSRNPRFPGAVTLRPGEGTHVRGSGAPEPPHAWAQNLVRNSLADTDVP